MSEHTKGPWRAGRMRGSIVANHPVPGFNGSDDVQGYGGHLVAETVAAQNVPIISAAPDMYDALHECLSQAKQIVIESHDGTGHCRYCGIGDSGQHDYDCVAWRAAGIVSVARAAIIKAKGREVKTHA